MNKTFLRVNTNQNIVSSLSDYSFTLRDFTMGTLTAAHAVTKGRLHSNDSTSVLQIKSSSSM